MVKGSCLCGKVKYQVELLEGKIFNCHCQFCRKAHGADYVTLASADSSTLKIDDEGQFFKEYEIDAGGFRAFCSNCGTRLMNYAPDKTVYLGVTLNTIDSAHNLKPVGHANVESKAHWCKPYPGITVYPGFPKGELGSP